MCGYLGCQCDPWGIISMAAAAWSDDSSTNAGTRRSSMDQETGALARKYNDITLCVTTCFEAAHAT